MNHFVMIVLLLSKTVPIISLTVVFPLLPVMAIVLGLISLRWWPAILRSAATSLLPQTATAASQLGVAALGAYGLDRAFDQQSVHSQPMSGGTGDRSLDNFIMSQQLQNQKFMHEMMLIQNRAESRTPGSQYGGMLKNIADYEKTLTDAGEITNREVLGVARSIYGTGFRA